MEIGGNWEVGKEWKIPPHLLMLKSEKKSESEVDSTMEWKWRNVMGRRKRMEDPSSPPDAQKVKCKVKVKWTQHWNGNLRKLIGSRKRMEAPSSPPTAQKVK